MDDASLRQFARLPIIGRVARSAMALRALTTDMTRHERGGVVLEHDGIPLPPMRLRDMVRKGGILAEDFILEGKQVQDSLLELLAANGISNTAALRVYEFGSGCGRVARHFISATEPSFTGSDVDEELVSWSRTHLAPTGSGRVEFFKNGYAPPLDRPEGAFDFAYSISVFTHMNAENQDAWMRELARVIAPGGYLALSILERSESEIPSGIRAEQRIDKAFKRSWLGRSGAPTVYFNTYNTVAHLSKLAEPQLKLIDQRRNAIRGKQSLLLFKKKE